MFNFNYKFLIFPLILFTFSCTSLSTIDSNLSNLANKVKNIASSNTCKGSDCGFKGSTDIKIKEEVLIYNESHNTMFFKGNGWLNAGSCKEGFSIKSNDEDFFVYLHQSADLILQLGFNNKSLILGNKIDLQVDDFKVLSNAIVEYKKLKETGHLFPSINITWFSTFLDQMSKGERLTLHYLDMNLTKKIEIELSGISDSFSRLKIKKNNPKCLS